MSFDARGDVHTASIYVAVVTEDDIP